MDFSELIQKVLPVQRVALRRTRPRIANNPPQFFFGSAKNKRVSHPGANPHLKEANSLPDMDKIRIQRLRGPDS